MNNVNKIISSILEDEENLKKYNALFTPRRIADRIRREVDRILNIFKKEEYHGDLDLREFEYFMPDVYDRITDLGNLRIVYGDLSLNKSKISNLGKLEKVYGSLYLSNTGVTNLGNLKYVGAFLIADNTKLTTLDPLIEVGRSIYLPGCADLVSLGSVELVGESINANDTSLSDLGLIKYLGGHLFADRTRLVTLDPLEEVRGSVSLAGCYNLVSLGSLREVGEEMNVSNTPLSDLGSLEYVGNSFYAFNTKLKDLGNLREVDGNFHLSGCSNLISLGSLREVGNNLYLNRTEVTDLSGLKSVGGYIFVDSYSQIVNKGKWSDKIVVALDDVM